MKKKERMETPVSRNLCFAIGFCGMLLNIGCYESFDTAMWDSSGGAGNAGSHDVGGSTDIPSTETDFVSSDSDTDGYDSESVDSETVTLPETVCNGADDNGNGIIDDVDNNRDGICDCLRIAVLGFIGTHGESDVFETWLVESTQLQVDPLLYVPLEEELLSGYDLVIAQDMSEYGIEQASAQADALENWVFNGGGFLSLSGYHGDSSEVNNINQLLEPFDISYGTANVMGDEDQTSTPVMTWYSHPISEGVSAVGMKYGRPVTGDGLLIAEGRGPSDSRSYPLGIAAEHGLGKVFVWADEWITYASEWVGRDDYQVERFWRNILQWLTPADRCAVPTEASEP